MLARRNASAIFHTTFLRTVQSLQAGTAGSSTEAVSAAKLIVTYTGTSAPAAASTSAGGILQGTREQANKCVSDIWVIRRNISAMRRTRHASISGATVKGRCRAT